MGKHVCLQYKKRYVLLCVCVCPEIDYQRKDVCMDLKCCLYNLLCPNRWKIGDDNKMWPKIEEEKTVPNFMKCQGNWFKIIFGFLEKQSCSKLHEMRRKLVDIFIVIIKETYIWIWKLLDDVKCEMWCRGLKFCLHIQIKRE